MIIWKTHGYKKNIIEIIGRFYTTIFFSYRCTFWSPNPSDRIENLTCLWPSTSIWYLFLPSQLLFYHFYPVYLWLQTRIFWYSSFDDDKIQDPSSHYQYIPLNMCRQQSKMNIFTSTWRNKHSSYRTETTEEGFHW